MTKDSIAIKVDSVSKNFKLPHEKQNSLKGAFLSKVRQKKGYEIQEALKDVSLEVKKGEFFGIVGRNGSGKSTLLKCIAGVYTPTKGGIHINGTLVPFIELGVGFNPELSGRDNVFLNGALLGFSRKQMNKMYDEIVEFAELEQFMDQKLKNYSSGMQVRLAFSIAIKAEGDILLLDEVLAVGDAAFQKKCYDYFAQLKRTNKTAILVTHDMNAVEKYCDRAVLLTEGRIKQVGSPQEIAYAYTAENTGVYSDGEMKRQQRVDSATLSRRGVSIQLLNNKGKEANEFEYGEEATLSLSWKNEEVKNVGVAIIKDTGEYVYGVNTILDDISLSDTSLEYRVGLRLGGGRYIFKVGLFGDSAEEKIDFIDTGPSFSVRAIPESSWGGISKLEHKWKA